jgi:hypothetical protein
LLEKEQLRMTPDEYVIKVVSNHTPSTAVDGIHAMSQLDPIVRRWANGHGYELKLSGSNAKGTSITGTTDFDIFISLDPSVGDYNTLEYVYTSLRNRLEIEGYLAREQNVSLGIEHVGLKIDLVPGVKHHPLGGDHSLYKRKADTWTKTNIDKHIQHVSKSFRTADIRAIKIWRKLWQIEFPSFYLELSVLEALKGKSLLKWSPAQNFVNVMTYLVDEFPDKRIIDPANTANEISDELSMSQKLLISNAAQETLNSPWEKAIW